MKPMKVLIGPLNGRGDWERYLRRVQDGYEMIFFADQDADITYDRSTATFNDILNQLPNNWRPDVVIIWHPEYFSVLPGLEECPYPVVALVGDWNLGFHGVIKVADCFDYIFTDLKGVEVYRKAGFKHVGHALLFGFDPTEHCYLEDVERIYDITIIGNLNHAVQKERSRWLARICDLSDRYTVRILTGFYGAEYTKILNQTKITFNRSIRGEMNMRAYEAVACGSLLFLEEENLEVREVFEHKIHCVLYNDRNLEELLDYYLTHEEERIKITKAGYKRVQEFSNRHQLKRILEQIQSLGILDKKPSRKFSSLSEVDKLKSRAFQYFNNPTIDYLLIEKTFQASASLDQSDPVIQNNLGVTYACLALCQDDHLNRQNLINLALSYFEKAKGLSERPAIIEANIGQALLELGKDDEAEEAFQRAIAKLDLCLPHQFSDELYFPRSFTTFRVEWERIGYDFAGDEQAYTNAMRNLYRWRLYESLGDIYAKHKKWEQAVQAYRQAVLAMPIGRTKYHFSIALEKIGQFEEAIEQLKQAIEDEPFLFPAYEALLRLLYRNECLDECIRVCKKALRLINACNLYESELPNFLVWEWSLMRWSNETNYKFAIEDCPYPLIPQMRQKFVELLEWVLSCEKFDHYEQVLPLLDRFYDEDGREEVLVRLYEKMGYWDMVIDSLLSLSKVKNLDNEKWRLLAKAALKKGMYEEADEIFLALLQNGEKEAEAISDYVSLAVSYLAQGKVKKAQQIVELVDQLNKISRCYSSLEEVEDK